MKKIEKLALLAFIAFVGYVTVVTTQVILSPIWELGQQAIQGIASIH